MFISESFVNYCHLPLDLLLRIINTTWSLPLTRQERIGIMTSWLLVSKDWNRLTAQVIFENVHIPNEAYYHWHRNFIQEGSSIFDEEIRCHARENCYSITFAYEDGVRLHSHRYPRYDAVPYLQEGHLDALTGLREVGVKYINSEYCDLDRDWWIYFVPEQVHTIRLLYITEETRTTTNENFQRVYTATSWPSYHYSREPTGVHTLHVSGLELEDCFHAAAIFPNVSAVWLDGKRVPAPRVSGPIDPNAFRKFRALPESGQEREEGIEAFAFNLMLMIYLAVQESENPLEETLKLLAKEAPGEFAKETVRMLSELKEKTNS